MARSVERGVITATVDFFHSLHARVTKTVPVDTGEARSGGRVAIGAPPTFKPPGEAPSYPIMDASEIDRTFASVQLGDRMFWGNKVPYIGLLELGRSKQAPNGFVEQAIGDAADDIENTRYKLVALI